MKTILTLALCLLSVTSAFAQNTQSITYKQAFEKSQRYSQKAQLAWNDKNEELTKAYRDSSISIFINSLVEPHVFKDRRNKPFSLGSIDKPVVLSASASWCTPCIAEIPAYNKIVEEYGDKVTFIILFHDTKDKLSALASKYNKQVILVPSAPRDIPNTDLDINGFKHSLGYPANYFISQDRQIVSVTLGAAVAGTKVTTEQAYQFNYEHLKNEIEHLLSKTKQL
ncbi:TlpA family protein disulfide reductase [Pontibacter cellulosilyticus]|uniref:Thioredoxin family protein n=1 Tax=Pontibacter cellulosilyticus TaxID=1720253 RepID=A0A923SQ77_9BACT|nr:thioredoxin family protein [Pontibacter cellulosilyticus]MBC5994885.1 thioredoxin family protein [Pontibacter cellulosilyticus]